MNICHIHDILIYYCHLEQMTIILSSFTHPRVIRTQDILRIIMFFCPFNESQCGPKWSHKLSFVKDRRCFNGTEQHCTPLTFILWTKKTWNVSQDIICLCSNDIRVSKLMTIFCPNCPLIRQFSQNRHCYSIYLIRFSTK